MSAVRVGAFQRIVGFSWPTDSPYAVLWFSFSYDGTWGDQLGATPEDEWLGGTGLGFEYVVTETIQYSTGAILGQVVSGAPAPQVTSYGAWEWVAQITGVGPYYANQAYILEPLSGAEITDGPDFGGEKARTGLTLTLNVYKTPFGDGTLKHYWNLDPFRPKRLAKPFSGVSDPTPTLENTELASTLAFNFSGVTLEKGDQTYHAVGMYWKPKTTGFSFFPYDARQIEVYVVMEREGSA
jgi:hypothetical protein